MGLGIARLTRWCIIRFMLTTLARALNYCKQGPGRFTPAQMRRLVKKAKGNRIKHENLQYSRLEEEVALAEAKGRKIQGIIVNEMLSSALARGRHLTEERARIAGNRGVTIIDDPTGIPRASVTVTHAAADQMG